jgi:hypothetical protein
MKRQSTAPGTPLTLGNALDNQLELIVGCDACGNSAQVDLAVPADQLRRDFAVPDIETLGRYTNCGERWAWVRVSAYKPPVTS